MPSTWIYPEWPLNEYISTYILSDYNDGFAGDMTHIYPTGSAVLCFSLDHPIVFKEVSSGQIIFHSRFNFIHQFRQPRIYQVMAFPAKVLHVIFKPYGAYRLLGIPQNMAFDEHGTPLLTMLSDKIAPLLIQVEDAAHNSSLVMKLVNQWLEMQLQKKKKLNVDHVRHACMLIETNRGDISIEQLAKEVWLSKRALEYQFQERVGLSPKLYSRITRFNTLLAGIDRRRGANWQDIIAEYNYFDQAHFIKEFKYFSGNSPAHLSKHRAIIS